MDLRKVTCKWCKKDVPLDESRYSDAHTILCLSCFNKKHPDRAVQPELRTPIPIKRLVPKENVKIENSGLDPVEFVKYECVNCGYNFSMKTETVRTKRCPYCSSRKIQLAKKPGDELNYLMDEAINPRYDR